MPQYIVLYKWTEQGIKALKDSPARAEAAIKATEATGIKMIGLWYTTGEYDLIAAVEAPNEDIGTAFTLSQGMQGFVRTTTLRARTVAEFAEVLKMVP
jgi:uncharacterized protein with GYD domain